MKALEALGRRKPILQLSTTKQVLGVSLLAGPLPGIMLVAINYKALNQLELFYSTLLFAVVTSSLFFYLIYQLDEWSPAWYWPPIMAFCVALCAEFLQGEVVDESLAAGEAVESSVPMLIKVSLAGMVGEFLLLLIGFSFV